jgi:hypothetical protein
MLVRLRTFGSDAVADAYEDFADAIRAFYLQGPNLQLMRKQSDKPDEVVRAYDERQSARSNVREKLAELGRLVSRELEAL